MKKKYIDAYMDVAERFAKLSSARKLQVGAIAVKDDRIISIGYNGMPAGWDNNCEYDDIGFTDAVFGQPQHVINRGLKTRPEVIHAEMNCLGKLAKTAESGEGATLFITHSPCIECAKGIYVAGIKTVYYRNDYKCSKGIQFLQNAGVKVEKI